MVWYLLVIKATLIIVQGVIRVHVRQTVCSFSRYLQLFPLCLQLIVSHVLYDVEYLLG
jgi:hypothetical protein